MAVGDANDLQIDNLYIVCEGNILCSIPQEKVVDGVFALLSAFYVFNIVYTEGKAVLSFLEQALIGIGRGQTLVSVSSFFNCITDL